MGPDDRRYAPKVFDEEPPVRRELLSLDLLPVDRRSVSKGGRERKEGGVFRRVAHDPFRWPAVPAHG